jgi:hypothetical protein
MPKTFVRFSNSTDAQKIPSTGDILTTNIHFFGYQSFSANKPVNNLAPVYFGINSGELPFIVQTGQVFNYYTADKKPVSLNEFWVQGSGSEGVYIVYQ